MGLNDTPSGERIHIGFFGKRNAGKSSLVNAITGQELSVVSDIKGTTTDPVSKSMELLPLGPVVITDTAGFDDSGKLGEMRIRKTKQILNKTDIAVLVVDSQEGISDYDNELIRLFESKNIPYIIAYNKSDIENVPCGTIQPNNSNCSTWNNSSEQKSKMFHVEQSEMKTKNVPRGTIEISVSALTHYNIHELKEKIANLYISENKKFILRDLINPEDIIILVTPIDESAPKGRLILPQQMTIRDILDSDAIAVVTKEFQLAKTLQKFPAPKMVITDSQAFGYVSKIVPENIPLTSFSILMARYKGFLQTAIKGASAIQNLNDGDNILISEACTHHRQCGDIGSIKLPALLKNFTGKSLNIHLSSGTDLPDDLSGFNLIIHCGGCMINERELTSRMNSAIQQNIPFTNYGIAIALMNGILKRSIQIFPDMVSLL
ncbi:MAG: [FeFe] hydrogenase H-cluster maturation GTPase HydF [Ruminococcus sp.]|nr:[FeFe] hydrogenase H-cluster maturation GTPase HydF [Ruminococcus sp.]